jgi:preprotein translocase subunit YajC
MDNLWILAQAGSQEAPSRIGSEPVGKEGQATSQAPGSPNTGPGGTPGGTPARSGNPYSMLLMLVALVAIMYLLLLRGPRKQQQQQRQMIQSLKKNDRVRTIGGIYGTVMDVKGDEDSREHVGHRQEPLPRGRQGVRTYNLLLTIYDLARQAPPPIQ